MAAVFTSSNMPTTSNLSGCTFLTIVRSAIAFPFVRRRSTEQTHASTMHTAQVRKQKQGRTSANRWRSLEQPPRRGRSRPRCRRQTAWKLRFCPMDVRRFWRLLLPSEPQQEKSHRTQGGGWCLPQRSVPRFPRTSEVGRNPSKGNLYRANASMLSTPEIDTAPCAVTLIAPPEPWAQSHFQTRVRTLGKHRHHCHGVSQSMSAASQSKSWGSAVRASHTTPPPRATFCVV